MKLAVHPDPQEPAGGFAYLELPAGTLGEGPVTVAVKEVYGGRWLAPTEDSGGRVAVDDTGWQGERHDFGPYEVRRHDGADWVRIGPEIVNRIGEYTPLQITVGGAVADVTWPDDVPPRAGAAVLGGILPTARPGAPDEQQALVGKPPAPEPPEPPEPAPPEEPPADPPQPAKAGAGRGLLWLVLLLVAGLAAALWYVLAGRDGGGDAQQASDPCTRAALVALDGFAATEKAIRACGDALGPDTVLAIVEEAAHANDPDALLLFGTLYDGAELDERIESVIGLSFDHDAAKAAEYYSRAVAAGSDRARRRLTATCAQLAGASETLARGAYDDYCR